jgi:hypothetical protein
LRRSTSACSRPEVRRFAPLFLLWWLAVAAKVPAAAAAAARSGACGFAPADADVTLSADGVSVILKKPLSSEEQRQWLARRARVLGRRASLPGYCKKTDRYLHYILERLTAIGGLESLRRLQPPLELVLQCDDEVPLPVARALAGNVLLVPRALPRLAASEDALAAVLAHELAHFSLQHAQRFRRSGIGSQRSAAARELVLAHESEADIAGLRILARAGYDPAAAIDHLQAVSAMHAALHPRARAPRHHEDDGVRAARLRSQIDACGYSFSGPRTPIPAAIVAELAGDADPSVRTSRTLAVPSGF